MLNLIRHPFAASDLTALFAAHPVRPLLPTIDDQHWRDAGRRPITRAWHESIRERAIAEIGQPLPVLSDALYADFALTGRRLPFEAQYFERRRRLARAVMATLLEKDEPIRQRLLASGLDKMRDIFAEPSWSLPAHVSTATGQDPMRIDLFAAETANLFGEFLNILGDRLDAAFRASIFDRLTTQIFENYLRNTFIWYEIPTNWNAVCHQGVLGAALATVNDPALLASLFIAAAPRLRIFLESFGKDGSSSEGVGYWSYGFGWFCHLNRQLESRSDGALSLFHDDPHVHAIAAFGPKMVLSNGNVVNFADCGPHATPGPALLSYLADRLDDSVIRQHAALAWKRTADAPPSMDQQRADLLYLTRLFLAAPDVVETAAALPTGDDVLQDLQVVVSRFTDERGHSWEFAVKAGHNAEAHNHNDIGSYLLNIDGQRLLIEIGVPEYDKAFFSDRRYESIAANSLGHPVPLINGQQQSAGENFCGKLTKIELSKTQCLITIDLTAAYPSEARCASAVRTIMVDKQAGTLSIADAIALTDDGEAESALITDAPVIRGEHEIIVSGAGISLRLIADNITRFDRIETHSYSDHNGKPAAVQRIVMTRRSSSDGVIRLGFIASVA